MLKEQWARKKPTELLRASFSELRSVRPQWQKLALEQGPQAKDEPRSADTEAVKMITF